MIIVSDTSPISNLILIGHLNLLPQLYERIIIPEVVYRELQALKNFGKDLSELYPAQWVEVRNFKNQSLYQKLLLQLDPGEAGAIALAMEVNASALLIDEKRGRKIAIESGIHTIGLLGVLVEAKKKGLIAGLKPMIDDLLFKANFWASPKLIEKILIDANEL
ncbi:MAG TPA: DUF3368 domain-containing protein [Chitinophagales bacterium]|nr:DUF3368 domain-containing protein [Chitinophagales bacterium]